MNADIKLLPMKSFLFCCTVLSLITSCGQTNKKSTSHNRDTKLVVSYCAPKTSDKDWYTTGTKAPLFKNLDGIDFKISTRNKETQDYFNQGLMLSYGFNHAEASRSFFEAARQDTTCAMAYWGYAYVLGPNYNAGMEDDNYGRAYAATQKAFTRSRLY